MINIDINLNNALVSVIFRILQIVPLVLLIIPIFGSYWVRRNTINGLRRTRLTLSLLLFSIIFENVLFILLGIEAVRENGVIAPSIPFLIVDRSLNLVAYWLLYYLFSHARHHDNPLNEK